MAFQLFARQKLTVIFVTHSVYESVYLSSRIAVIGHRPGRVTADLLIEYPTRERKNFACRGFTVSLPAGIDGVAPRHDCRRSVRWLSRHLVPTESKTFAHYSHASGSRPATMCGFCTTRHNEDNKIP